MAQQSQVLEYASDPRRARWRRRVTCGLIDWHGNDVEGHSGTVDVYLGDDDKMRFVQRDPATTRGL